MKKPPLSAMKDYANFWRKRFADKKHDPTFIAAMHPFLNFIEHMEVDVIVMGGKVEVYINGTPASIASVNIHKPRWWERLLAKLMPIDRDHPFHP